MNKKYINPKTGKKYSFFDRKGNGTDDVLMWAKMFEGKASKKEYRIVKQEYTWLGFHVSTVWLGLDHSFGADTDPLIFETMVFRPGSWAELDMDRYTTEKQAKIGHNVLVCKWSNPLYILFKLIDQKTWSIQWKFNKLLRKIRKRT